MNKSKTEVPLRSILIPQETYEKFRMFCYSERYVLRRITEKLILDYLAEVLNELWVFRHFKNELSQLGILVSMHTTANTEDTTSNEITITFSAELTNFLTAKPYQFLAVLLPWSHTKISKPIKIEAKKLHLPKVPLPPAKSNSDTQQPPTHSSTPPAAPIFSASASLIYLIDGTVHFPGFLFVKSNGMLGILFRDIGSGNSFTEHVLSKQQAEQYKKALIT